MKKALNTFLDSNVLVRGFKILAMTSNKTSGIFSYRGVKHYFYVTNNEVVIQ
jgi:hypothetical protein